ncbi:MAG TPA: hypothetical protein PLB62_01990 [Candidatus Sumerlaeota bacterium]|nr:hypothetical protein [Candidatus Sumerlaeota bacterium]
MKGTIKIYLFFINFTIFLLINCNTYCENVFINGEAFMKFEIGSDPLSGMEIYFINQKEHYSIVNNILSRIQQEIFNNNAKMIKNNNEISIINGEINEFESNISIVNPDIQALNTEIDQLNIKIQYYEKIINNNMNILLGLIKNYNQISEIQLLIIKLGVYLECFSNDYLIPQNIIENNHNIINKFKSIQKVIIPKELSKDDRVYLTSLHGDDIYIDNNINIKITNSNNEINIISLGIGKISPYDVTNMISIGENYFEIICNDYNWKMFHKAPIQIKYLVPEYSVNFNDELKNNPRWQMRLPINDWEYKCLHNARVYTSLNVDRQAFKNLLKKDIEIIEKNINNIIKNNSIQIKNRTRLSDMQSHIRLLNEKMIEVRNQKNEKALNLNNIMQKYYKLKNEVYFLNTDKNDKLKDNASLEYQNNKICNMEIDNYKNQLLKNSEIGVTANICGNFSARLSKQNRYYLFACYRFRRKDYNWLIPIDTNKYYQNIILSNLNSLSNEELIEVSIKNKLSSDYQLK